MMHPEKILHVMVLDKFLAPYIDFVDEFFGRDEHHYVFITSEKYQFALTPEHKAEFLYTDDDIFGTLLEYMNQAKKVIIHGLWRDKVDMLLLDNPNLFDKTYWVLWGGDFYFPEKQNENRKKVIAKIQNFVGVVSGDYTYLQEHYSAEGNFFQCVIYPRNLLPERKEFYANAKPRLLVGNSSTQTNRHIEVFEKLKKYDYKDFEVVSPLSYGDFKYGMEVMKRGYEQFHDNFHPLIDYMAYEDYMEVLKNVDIAAFNNNRQQGLGNLVTLLSLGKTVYLNHETTTWEYLASFGLIIRRFDDISLELLPQEEREKNIEIMYGHFSQEASAAQWHRIFTHG
ncbi:TDP-N-acetylfucosamine:lipid II N-acetylfucosaminyltransferase [bacterium]|nr:TDP-N-acetylfucosamine:lipid II N-acetylfucosaminyltransferase [bacterium]MBU1884201.1 TDP-N-acetylfucosamine:lipid II N-acetylfucosaminyltransferase [bacterium]